MSSAAAPASLLEREIGAQPEVLARFLEREGARVQALGAELGRAAPSGVLIAARGSSDHAAVYAKYLLGLRLGVPVALAAPSFATVYGRPLVLDGWVVLGISQSGVSPDVVSVLALARDQGCPTLAITDDPASPLARAAGERVLLHLGGERSVAATASFTTSLYALAHLCAGWEGAAVESELADVPERVARALDCRGPARRLAQRLAGSGVLAVIGRGFGFSVALELSLKLKELARVFAEPFSAADYRHGPIALASATVPAVLCDLGGPARAGLDSLAQELVARGAPLAILSSTPGADLPFPDGPEWLAPIPAAVAAQRLAQELALARGLDPDRPAGLTKVTRTF